MKYARSAIAASVGALAVFFVVRVRFVFVSAIDTSLNSKDFVHRYSTNLELFLVGLARPDRALKLVPRTPERARQRRPRVALGPPEDLDRNGHAAECNRAVHGGPAQAGLARGDRAGDRRREHR